MNVTLTPEFEAMIHRKVESGLYHDASEVVRDALRLMAERDAHERLRAEVRLGFEQIEGGEVVPYTPDLMARLKREASEQAKRGAPIKDAVAL